MVSTFYPTSSNNLCYQGLTTNGGLIDSTVLYYIMYRLSSFYSIYEYDTSNMVYISHVHTDSATSGLVCTGNPLQQL